MLEARDCFKSIPCSYAPAQTPSPGTQRNPPACSHCLPPSTPGLASPRLASPTRCSHILIS
ncbi:hypothetical protein E2C01_067000 [Portunus trituberculatus]|uniref:Uncharacterized protein n=1 Tax=Portunus trituberculatus TaxID=210409 RepID=A0A5B7HVF2_PORTR|nr:hypothetical protein [Portunus trituberculatus]